MARCNNDKCNWIGKLEELKDSTNHSGKWFYVMVLTKGIVTSHSIIVNGSKVKYI